MQAVITYAKQQYVSPPHKYILLPHTNTFHGHRQIFNSCNQTALSAAKKLKFMFEAECILYKVGVPSQTNSYLNHQMQCKSASWTYSKILPRMTKRHILGVFVACALRVFAFVYLTLHEVLARVQSGGLHPMDSCKSSLLVISLIGLVQLCQRDRFLRSIIVSRICQKC